MAGRNHPARHLNRIGKSPTIWMTQMNRFVSPLIQSMNKSALEPGPIVRVVGGIPVRGGRILLGLRSPHRHSYPSVWDIIGGHVEPNETASQTLRREFLEELGIEPSRFDLVEDLIIPDGGNHLRLTIFRIDAWQGQPRLANDEHSALRWFGARDIGEATPLASEAYLPLFDRLLSG